MTITVYGIPTCGTVKKARKWLDERGIEYDWIDFRKTPPLPKQVERWFEVFGVKSMKNTSGGAYRAFGPEKKTWSDKRWLEEFKKDPMLLKRPIIEIDGEPITIGFKEDFYKERFAM